jgi:hypothetical protein
VFKGSVTEHSAPSFGKHHDIILLNKHQHSCQDVWQHYHCVPVCLFGRHAVAASASAAVKEKEVLLSA